MNAYELADILHQSDFLAMDFADDAATMLRQQADRITELETENAKIKTKLIGKALVKALDGFTEKNKPVAYWDGKHFASKEKSSLADIPVYTHPVKQLSDEEIEEIIRKHWNREYGNRNMMAFARAIIKEITE